jgi:hypothetical protein
MVMFGTPEDFDRTTIMLTRISKYAGISDTTLPIYVPFALKKSHPELYGNYLAQQDEFLNTHRNIAIAGLHPDAMRGKVWFSW